MLEVAQENAECLNTEYFTFENFMRAQYQVGTRCFGYAIPELSLVPFADNANHQATDNQYEMFNSRLHKRVSLDGEDSLDVLERNYLTPDRKKIDFLRHFKEDD